MTSNACETIVNRYLADLRMGFEVSPSEDGCFLSTPYTRPDGEGFEFEVRTLPDGRICMSDMGDTIGYLFVNGLTLSQALLASARQIAKTHGVSLQRNELNVEADADSIGEGVQGLVQAALSVSNLIHRRRTGSRIRFDDDVESFIIHSGVIYDVDYTLKGQRETHRIKFHVDSGRALLIHPLVASTQAAGRSWAERMAYRFSDILMADPHWQPVALLDDRKTGAEVWSAHTVTPVEEYAIRWSERDQLERKLVG